MLKGKQCRTSSCLRKILVCSSILLVLYIATSLYIQHITVTDYHKLINLSPGETRLVKLSNFFCEKFTVKKKSTGSSVSIDLLSSGDHFPLKQSLLKFQISANINLRSDYYNYYRYYLYPNSSVTLRACGSNVPFYAIKGPSANKLWWKKPLLRNVAQYKNAVNNSCNINSEVFIRINEEDNWFFAFYNPFHRRALVYFVLNFSSYQYLKPSSDHPHCSTGPSSYCTMAVTNSDYALITGSISDDVDWLEDILIEWYCSNTITTVIRYVTYFTLLVFFVILQALYFVIFITISQSDLPLLNKFLIFCLSSVFFVLVLLLFGYFYL